MYEGKQADPAEWSSPPWEAALVEKPGLGKVLLGRGAVNQKGPEAAFLAALHAIRGVGRKLPVNLVLVAEGEEEIGSPHFPQIVRRPEVQAALRRCIGIFMPAASQGLDGEVTITLGAKGVVELELIASANAGVADHAATSTRATRRGWTAQLGTSWRLWRRLSHPTATTPPSRASPTRRARSPQPRRR